MTNGKIRGPDIIPRMNGDFCFVQPSVSAYGIVVSVVIIEMSTANFHEGRLSRARYRVLSRTPRVYGTSARTESPLVIVQRKLIHASKTVRWPDVENVRRRRKNNFGRSLDKSDGMTVSETADRKYHYYVVYNKTFASGQS